MNDDVLRNKIIVYVKQRRQHRHQHRHYNRFSSAKTIIVSVSTSVLNFPCFLCLVLNFLCFFVFIK